jgi:hypothetical protein
MLQLTINFKMQFKCFIIPFLASTAAAQTVYLIRHGEKPADGSNGLTAQGEQRAQCLRTVFGASSQYNIGYVIAEQPKPGPSLIPTSPQDQEVGADFSTRRWQAHPDPLKTVQPLASDLGLTVDTSCDRDEANCVASLVEAFGEIGDWEGGFDLLGA